MWQRVNVLLQLAAATGSLALLLTGDLLLQLDSCLLGQELNPDTCQVVPVLLILLELLLNVSAPSASRRVPFELYMERISLLFQEAVASFQSIH